MVASWSGVVKREVRVGSGREWSGVVGSGREWSGVVVGSGWEWPVSIQSLKGQPKMFAYGPVPTAPDH